MSYRNDTIPGSVSYLLNNPQLSIAVRHNLTLIAEAPARLREIRAQLGLDQAAAYERAANDRSLSDEGRREREAELLQSAQQRADQAADRLRQSVIDAAGVVRDAAAARLPMPAAGTDGLLGRQAAWQRLKQLLDAGWQVRRVVERTTDPEELHALDEELPVWLEAKGAEPLTIARVRSQIQLQLAGAAGEEVAAYLAASRAVEIELEELLPKLGGHNRPSGSLGALTDSLTTAVLGRMNAQRTQARYVWDAPIEPKPAAG